MNSLLLTQKSVTPLAHHCVLYWELEDGDYSSYSAASHEIWTDYPTQATVVPHHWLFSYKTIQFPWGKNREFFYLRCPKWMKTPDGYTMEEDDIDQQPKETWPVYECRTLYSHGNRFTPFVWHYYWESYENGVVPEDDALANIFWSSQLTTQE